MKRYLFVFLVSVAVLLGASACTTNGATPISTLPPQPRTARPTWTLPFRLSTPTPLPADVSSSTVRTPAPTQPPPTVILPTAVPHTPTPTVPPRLIIPELDLDQSIVAVLIVDGTWDMTPLDEQIGWLTTTGKQPGGDLAVTLAGHVNISFGHSGPFLNLGRLDIGDQVIYRFDGVDYVYAVRGQETVKPETVDALYVADGQRLLLVTCSRWSYFSGHYARRLIVTAELIHTEPPH